MKSSFRMLGWLLLVMGLVLGGLAGLAQAGIVPLGINVFGRSVETRDGRVGWIVGCVVAAGIGAMLLRVTRRNWTRHA